MRPGGAIHIDMLGPDFIHLQVECSKLAFADREAFYGDPDFVEVPMATLLSDAYNAKRRKLISNKASLKQRPGSIEGFGAVIKLRRKSQPLAAGAGEPEATGAASSVSRPRRVGSATADSTESSCPSSRSVTA